MLFVDTTTHARYEVKKSTFTSYLLPYSHFQDYHDKLKKEHPKASHIVWAFRRLNEHKQIIEGSNDDGEPKGVAGTPTLNVLRGEDLIDTALLTVRYFGGTKLGTGGMVRAYTKSAKEAITQSNLLPYIHKEPFSFTTPYALINRYEHYCNTQGILYHDREFKEQSVRWSLLLSQAEKESFEHFIKNL